MKKLDIELSDEQLEKLVWLLEGADICPGHIIRDGLTQCDPQQKRSAGVPCGHYHYCSDCWRHELEKHVKKGFEG